MNELKTNGIGTQVHYIPVNSQLYYVKKYGEYKPGNYPASAAYYNTCLSIPLYPKMSNDDVEYVIAALSSLDG
jgi:dTDP-4-amino-4,6-dideoxygalactose transaminase